MAHPITIPEQRERSIAADPNDQLGPSLTAWRDAKIRDLGYCLAVFFNYLSIPRIGFLEVSRKQGITTILPEITFEMSLYLLQEILPCSNIKETAWSVFKVPFAYDRAIRKAITSHMSNRSFFGSVKTKQDLITTSGAKQVSIEVPALTIDQGAIQSIWTFISNGMDALAHGSKSDQDIRDKIEEAEMETLNRRNAIRNYGFNDELENSAFQAILYVIVSLCDWLEVNEITPAEVETAYRLLVPPDLQRRLEPTKSFTLSEIISAGIIGTNLIPTEGAVELIASIMVEVQKYMEQLGNPSARRVINRMMAFSQPV